MAGLTTDEMYNLYDLLARLKVSILAAEQEKSLEAVE